MSEQQPPGPGPFVLPPPSGQPLPSFRPAGPGWNGPPPSNKMAIAALVCAILPIPLTWVAAIVLGIMVLVGVRKGEQRGQGMAIAALIICAIWIALVTIAIAAGVSEVVDQAKARDTGSGDISVTKIRVGDCLVELPTAAEVYTVEIAPCAEPHRGEVFATFPIDLDSDAEQSAIDRLAEGGCTTRFIKYVGVDFNDSELDVTYLPPLASTMAIDNKVACLVTVGGKETTGSLKGSKR